MNSIAGNFKYVFNWFFACNVQRMVDGSRHLFRADALQQLLRTASPPKPYSGTAAKFNDDFEIGPVPEARYEEVLKHITPIFLRDEPLSKSFSPCNTGKRASEFSSYAKEQLQGGLCLMAVEKSTGKVIGSCLCRSITRDYIMEQKYEDCDQDDDFVPQVVRLITVIHQNLDLFSALGVDEIFEIGLVSVELTHAGRGLATKLFRASLEMAAKKGFKVAKADASGTASAKACLRAGMTPVHVLNYCDYKVDNRVIFAKTAEANPVLTVMVAKLQKEHPYVLPIPIDKGNSHL